MFELQMSNGILQIREKEQKGKIFISCIDCTIVLFYGINNSSTTYKCTLCHDTVAIKKKLWIHVNKDSLSHRIALMWRIYIVGFELLDLDLRIKQLKSKPMKVNYYAVILLRDNYT